MSYSDKPKCYSCHFRQEASGGHSACEFPLDASTKMLAAAAMMIRGGRLKLDNVDVEFDPHGVRNGWASWPLNFDPIWLRHCSLYWSKEAAAAAAEKKKLEGEKTDDPQV